MRDSGGTRIGTRANARLRRGILAISLGLVATGLTASLALGQGYEGYGGYGPGGYGPGYGPGGEGGIGRVDLKLRGKKKQRSEKAVKVKASCGTRACMLDTRGRLTSKEGNGKLKPKRDVPIDPRETVKLKLKLNRKAKRAASDAEKSKVVVKGKAIGSGGGGTDKARKRIKLKS
jgi:hypothetical protein